MDILREGVKKQPRNSFVSPPVPRIFVSISRYVLVALSFFTEAKLHLLCFCKDLASGVSQTLALYAKVYFS